MPNTKKSSPKRKTVPANSNIKSSGNKDHGMTPGQMPHIPTARERAREMDNNRRWNAQTFEL